MKHSNKEYASNLNKESLIFICKNMYIGTKEYSGVK